MSIFQKIKLRIQRKVRAQQISSKGNVCISNYRVLNVDKNATILAQKDSRVEIQGSISVRDHTHIEAFGTGKVILEDGIFINRCCTIVAKEEIRIGKGTTIGPNVLLYDHDHALHGEDTPFVSRPIVIGNNVWIGGGAIILKGVTIGSGAVVAAGAIITHDVPENTVVYCEKQIRYKPFGEI